MECVFSSSSSELITSKLGGMRSEGEQALSKALVHAELLLEGYELHPT